MAVNATFNPSMMGDNNVKFLHQIIDLPKSAYRTTVETPSTIERFTRWLLWIWMFLWGLIKPILRFIVRILVTVDDIASSEWQPWARKDDYLHLIDRYRLARFVFGVCITIVAEDTLVALMTPLLPTMAVA